MENITMQATVPIPRDCPNPTLGMPVAEYQADIYTISHLELVSSSLSSDFSDHLHLSSGYYCHNSRLPCPHLLYDDKKAS